MTIMTTSINDTFCHSTLNMMPSHFQQPMIFITTDIQVSNKDGMYSLNSAY